VVAAAGELGLACWGFIYIHLPTALQGYNYNNIIIMAKNRAIKIVIEIYSYNSTRENYIL
jgi:hypothetical protein